LRDLCHLALPYGRLPLVGSYYSIYHLRVMRAQAALR
jgi:hypothetical protein